MVTCKVCGRVKGYNRIQVCKDCEALIDEFGNRLHESKLLESQSKHLLVCANQFEHFTAEFLAHIAECHCSYFQLYILNDEIIAKCLGCRMEINLGNLPQSKPGLLTYFKVTKP